MQAMLNLGLAMKQAEELGYVSGSMVCVNAFQLLYVWCAAGSPPAHRSRMLARWL